MKLNLEMNLDNAAFEEGRPEEIARKEARQYIAAQYRMARNCGKGLGHQLARPSYASRSYTLRPHLMRFDD